jgi:4-hydroxy-2-oxovalerate aldolase
MECVGTRGTAMMTDHHRVPSVMDCTLRDGSYAVSFRFTADDTTSIATGLEAAGVELIEVGHGVGLGAAQKGFGDAAETDLGYMQAAAGALTTARWGMFCIPGIGTLDQVRQAIDQGMGFLRVGVTFDAFREAEPFVDLARHRGLLTCVNVMRSYTRPPADFGRLVPVVEAFGADIVYLVDSAGGMLPEQIAAYVQAVREQSSSVRLGFHGHNNLGLAVANALQAVALGVEVIDASLMGLGRGAGNTPIEQFICALVRRGLGCDIDPLALLDLSDRHIVPLGAMHGSPSLDVVSGLALFHSSSMSTIMKHAEKHQVDPRRLILAVSAVDQTHVSEDLIEAKALELARAGVHSSWKSFSRLSHGRAPE